MTTSDFIPGPEPVIGEAGIRKLRHDIADFLQKVYAVVAILQTRLPSEWEKERSLLAGLRSQAQECKRLLDSVQDLVCPISLEAQPVDLAKVTCDLAEEARAAHPQLQIRSEASGTVEVRGDRDHLTALGRALLANACEAAAREVTITAAVDEGSGQACWTFRDDGPGVTEDDRPHIFSPFFSTRARRAGLGLPLARKLASLHGGSIEAANRAEGGFEVVVRLPAGNCRPT